MRIKRRWEFNGWVWRVRVVTRFPKGIKPRSKRWQVDGACQPYTDRTGTIYIRRGMSDLDTLSTLVHELFHALEFSFGFSIPHKWLDIFDEAVAKAWLNNMKRVRKTAVSSP